MDKNSAIKLIQDAFQNPFSREKFITFTKNLFNFLNTERNFIYRGNFIPDAYKPYINTLERIGKYEDKEDNKIDVLIVHLKKEHSIEHARTMQRNFIAWYLAGSRGGELKDAALVAFHTDNPDDWRFSLVKMEYQIVESETGKIKTKTELTPARRFSFLVGKNENSHTAQRQFLPILQDDKDNPLLSDFEKAFNIEVVTQEFFEKYKSLFLDVKDSLEHFMKKDQAIASDFSNKGVNSVDFSKKLLGQIVFLYFLQKKGWFGVGRDNNWGTGPKNFLRLLFEKMMADYKNFFNDILEPLFYEALAKERDDDFYSRFNCRIPFLNGGLFDPISDYDWVHTDINLPDELFSNHIRTKEGDIGTGILDIFDRYNFTVKEDEPLEKEVAVDPEMLGKVFENLLEVKDRKSKGTYYTPREIVHYMCKESLINYLVNECEDKVNKEDIETLIQFGESAVEHDSRVEQEGKETSTYSYKLSESLRNNAQLIDDRLKNIRVCDPAIGSGAFPVGMMNEIVRTRNTLTNYLEDKQGRSIYNFKRDAIQNSLYGVDIDPGAVEIAKLRLWLSLVVDEEDMKQIKPLPNLDYKIMQGNSLLEEFEGVKLFDDRLLNADVPVNDDQINKLGIREKEIQKNLMPYYQKNPLWMKNEKIERPTELYQLEGELKRVQLAIKGERAFRFQIKDSNQSALFDNEQKARKIWEALQSLQQEFFETTQKTRKDYLRRQIEKLEWELIEVTLREQDKISSLQKLEQYRISNIRPFFLWKLNFAEVFQEKGGFDVVIANPPYISAWSMEKDDPKMRPEIKNALKEYSILVGHWDLYIAFVAIGHKLLKLNGGLSYIIPNPVLQEKYAASTRKFLLDEMNLLKLLEFNDVNVFENVSRRTTVILASKKKDSSDYNIQIFSNQESNGIVLVNTISVNSWLNNPGYAILIGGNPETDDLLKKLETQSQRIGNFFYVNYGAQVCSKEKGGFGKKEVVGNRPEGNSKEFYEGKDVQKWRLGYRNLWLDYREHDMYGPRAVELFEQEKIVVRDISDHDHSIAAALDKTNRYTDNTNTLLVSYSSVENTALRAKFKGYEETLDSFLDLRYVLSMLLSSLEHFYFKNRFAAKSLQGSSSHTYPASVRALIIKPLNQEEQKPFIEIVDKILNITGDDGYLLNAEKQERVKEYEKQIDQMVYKLYDLTPEEKNIVENS